MNDAALRKQWIAFWRAHHDGCTDTAHLPDFLRGLTCGAKTRAGTPCKRLDLAHANGRCKLHGGLSTGPKTEAGKARSGLNGKPSADHCGEASAAAESPVIEQAVVVLVRCVECRHISAANTCRLDLAGRMQMGVLRVCQKFEHGDAWPR